MKEATIIGGGIGGLTTALMLARRGMQVRVLERAPEFAEVGAGLQLAPNVTRVLARWGLLDELDPFVVRPRRLVAFDGVSGEELTELDLADAERRYGGPYIVLHRSDLLTTLLRACQREPGIELLPGSPVAGVQDQGERVLIRLADGRELTTAVLIGADGLRSVVRPTLVADEPVNSGYVAYRGTLAAEDMLPGTPMDEVRVFFAPGAHLVQYPVRAGELYNQVAVFRSASYAAGAEDWGTPEELDAAYAGCCDHVTSAIPSLHRNRRWPMADRDPAPRWTAGRVALLGDAAHAMLQYLAQGAGQAILDADALAGRLPGLPAGPDTDQVARALAGYETARLPVASAVQTAARAWGEMWHVDGPAASLRNEAFRLRRPDDYRHIDWLYGPAQPTAVPSDPDPVPAPLGR